MSNNQGIKNPKLIIGQYYDSLIHKIDIFTEEQLAQLSDDQLIETSMVKQHPKKSKDPTKKDSNLDELNLDTVEFDCDLWSQYEEEKYVPDEHNYLYGFDTSSNRMPMHDDKQSRMKARDYYNQARDEMIDELTKLQVEAFTRYDMIKSELKRDNFAERRWAIRDA